MSFFDGLNGMVIKVFLALLLLNLAVFWAKAYADEPFAKKSGDSPAVEISKENRAVTTGQIGETTDEALTTLGMRLLRWHFSAQHPHRYAYENIREDHSISLLQGGGAALNLEWRF